MCYEGRSVIRGDPMKSYYCEVEKIFNIYGIQLCIGGAYEKNVLTYICNSWFGIMGWCNMMM